MLLCKDCKHIELAGPFVTTDDPYFLAKCGHEDTTTKSTDPVTGERSTRKLCAKDARVIGLACGLDAKLFEPSEAP